MCTKSATRKIVGGAAALCVLMFASSAVADIGETVLELTAEVGTFEFTIPIPFDWGDYDAEAQTWTFDLPAPMSFGSLATLDALSVTIQEDPEVNLNFSVQAGSADTSFHIASSLMTFPTITGATGNATAGVTVTSFDASGATLTRNPSLSGAYLAQYNGWAGHPVGPQGTDFHSGIDQVIAVPFSSNADSTTLGWTPIAAPVSSMSTLFSFDLTANDLASGTSHFEIVPEPASLLLIGIGALALVRRR